MFVSRNPYTTLFIREYESLADSEIGPLLDAATAAFKEWRSRDLADRCAYIHGLAERMAASREQLAQAMTEEMGKPLTQARAEVDKSVLVTRSLAEQAMEALEARPVAVDEAEVIIRFQPLGVLLAIMPWNFPLNQVVRAAVPALLAGNAVVLKHSPNVQGSAELIAELFSAEDVPEALYSNCRATESQLARMIGDSRVAAVTLTGSERAGRAVAALAGQHLKPALFELGGSDPFIVFEDANLDEAVRVAVRARLQNSGQSCIAAKRFLIHESVYDSFVARLAAAFEEVQLGDPSKEETEVGPLARLDLLKNLERQVEASVQAGAEVRCGGVRAEGPGYVYQPTVLANIQTGMAAFDEEVFGPVAAVLRFSNEEEALSLANATTYGLGASLWTKDQARKERFSAQLESGMLFCNEMVRSDPRVPFGGVKASGFGRELGEYGLKSFVNVKLDWRSSAS